MKVEDVMTREVVTFKESDTLSLVNDVMTLGRIRHFPVVDGRERPVGMLTQRDLYRAALSHRVGAGAKEQREHLDRLVVRDEMSRPVLTAEAGEELSAALERMIEKRVGALVVVENGKLAGLLTETDLLRALRDLLK
jgi:CBS domain-containing membrane protein